MARTHLGRLAISIVFLAMVVEIAPAQTANNIVQVAGRIATFLQPGLSGQVTAAIVYQTGDPTSEREARAIENALGSGLVVGSLKLRPKRVSMSALGQLSGTKVAFVTRGTNYRGVASAAAPLSILTISADPTCAQAGYCVVSIVSTSRVQITVSKTAARAAKLRFSSGFLMLIKEI